ncbi:MAG: GreA/GreB family elongation factor [Parvibaculum sp.]|nr:GreA/GreB family elongation factor [Parvibaculum sp.]
MSQIHDAARAAAKGLVLSAHDAARLETMALEAGGDLRQQISAKLDNALFINGNDIADDIATIGSVLRYQIGDGAIQRRTLSLPDVSHPNGQFINLLTPVGLALLGCRAGDKLTAPLVDGGALELHLLDVEFQPEAEVRRRSSLRPDDDGPGAA